VRLSVQQVFGS
jgi:hypothetical protein